jgi:hypothetical protein
MNGLRTVRDMVEGVVRLQAAQQAMGRATGEQA